MEILDKSILAETEGTRVVKIEVNQPLIASKAEAGQFVVLMAKAEGERIPLTVVDKDVAKGSITLIFQELGLTTKFLGKLKKGDSLYSIAGPLGHPTEIKKYGNVILVGGGVGIAEIYPVAKALKEAGNCVIAIIGARTKELLILENELKNISDELHITTDDGSYSRKGFVTDILKESLTCNLKLKTYNLIYAVGPIPMMRMVSSIGFEHKIKTVVSLNALMVDGTGMCGSCRVTVGGKIKFSCVDGPEFEGALIDWDEFEKRSRIYADKEKHICKLRGLN
ncbi:MAG: sulfide/dihydroorotate dehydrogenase-like FAD/NAD-binding protein [Candidatus Omnitrophica bacterium]|nr:sulfide/dihydroorotate dehydrogenase-like FAD/NAD-binding protein [Candidatus Omnitrophota bacterium]